jgi:hypothetical protein
MRILQGKRPMPKDIDARRRRHTREKSVIDHLAREMYKPKSEKKATQERHPKAVTSDGLSVEEQVRKEWDPRKGGLPIFYG